VGDAAGQTADRLELLRVQELTLELLPLGDVDEVALDQLRVARLLEDRHRLVVDPDHAPVRPDHAVVAAEGAQVLAALPHRREHRLAVVRMEHGLEEARPADPLLDRIAGDALDLRTDPERLGDRGETVRVRDDREPFREGSPQPAIISHSLSFYTR